MAAFGVALGERTRPLAQGHGALPGRSVAANRPRNTQPVSLTALAVNAPFLRDFLEQLWFGACRFGSSEPEVPVRLQGEMHGAQRCMLCRRFEVDENVAAAHKVYS